MLAQFSLYIYIHIRALVISPKQRGVTVNKNLNKDQTTILELLYQFRFATSTLLTQHLKPTNRESLNSRLNILTKQEYIGRKYDKSYKLLGKPAIYYLLPKAFAVLKQQEDTSAKVLKNMYKDRQASDTFISHCLSIFAASNQLEAIYGGRVELFTKSELIELEHFPQPLPDAFISLKGSNQPRARSKHFFLLILADDTPFFVNIRKIKQYFEYAEDNEWGVTGKKLPALLAMCESQTLQKRLIKRVSSDPEDTEEARVYLTTHGQFQSVTAEDDRLWQLVSKPNALFSLSDIS
jgi:hypothetical protein